MSEDTWKPQYLYIEQHITEPKQKETAQMNPEEKDDTDRGVVIIDILLD